MSDTKTLTQELSDASLSILESFKETSGGTSSSNLGDQKEHYDIMVKILEKIDELTAEVNTLKNQ